MNTFAKQIVGATIGGAIGWFVATVITDIIELQEQPDLPWVDGTENDPTDHPEEDIFLKKETQKTSMKTTNKLKQKSYTEYFISQDRPDLASLAAKYNNEEVKEPVTGEEVDGVDVDVVYEEEWDEIVDAAVETDPSIISLAEFANADEGFETLTLNYYDDDVVTDERDNPINRPERILGEEALVSFGVLSEDEDVVYVRNLAKKALYEVVRTNKVYAAPRTRSLKDVLTAKEKGHTWGDGEHLKSKEKQDGEEDNT